MAGHWLRTNERQWSPRWVGAFDTETRPEPLEAGELHRPRCWALSVVDRRPERPGDRVATSCRGTTPAELADELVRVTRSMRTVWLYAHNLTFDLTVTRLPDEMVRRGWHLADISLVGRSTRAHLRKGDRHLWLLDSWSLLPKSLAAIGEALGYRKGTMPTWDAPDDEWADYCARDVSVLLHALLTVMEWWDAEGLGSFSRTGPACGWNAMRHMMRRHTVLVRGDEADRAQDRLAIRGGRRDATRVGQVFGGPFALLDFRHSYVSVAEHCRLPVQRLGHREAFTATEATDPGSIFGVLAEAELFTDAPSWPARVGDITCYPVGHFRTVLAGPELASARAAGSLVAVGAGQRHRLDRPLTDWGRWAAERLADGQRACPPVAAMAVQQWGRSVIGKFAARSSRTIDLGAPNWPGWHMERGTFGPDHQPFYDVVAGGRHFGLIRDLESDESYPAVLAWVEAEVRAALGRMLDALGPELWVTADTDGAFVDLRGARRWLSERTGRRAGSMRPALLAERLCEALGPVTAPLVPRVKLVADTLEVAGPQHLRAGDYVRASGRPRGELDPSTGQPRWMTWPGLAWQVERGHPDGYVRAATSWTDPGLTVARWVLPDGRCVPLRLRLGPGGANELVPWDEDLRSYRLGPLADVQSPAVAALAAGELRPVPKLVNR